MIVDQVKKRKKIPQQLNGCESYNEQQNHTFNSSIREKEVEIYVKLFDNFSFFEYKKDDNLFMTL